MGLFSGSRPGNLGVVNGMLARCKASPNCVSSQADPATDPGHYIQPLAANGDVAKTWTSLRKLLAQWPRVAVIVDGEHYLHAEFSTRLMGFVDDVEFLLSGDVIHVRSASRLGRSDFGVNRARIESVRTRLAAMLSR